MVPGKAPVSVGAFDCRDEAERVRDKLDLMNEDPEAEPIPDEFAEMLVQI